MVSQVTQASSVWVKICGITNLEDALLAVQAGADALGFNFVPTSLRVITRRRACEILSALPDTVMTVAVVANESQEFLKGLLRVCPFKALQFHGEEPLKQLLAFKGLAKLIKAIRVKDAESVQEIPGYEGVDAILLDSYLPAGQGGRPEKRGGTGVPFDWRAASKAKAFGIPVIVAGGLHPGNVAQVVREVQPYGVDVTSGVEESPGKKDHALLRQFVLAAKKGGFYNSRGVVVKEVGL